VSHVRLTQHAKDKFDVLKRHGFEVTPRQVEVEGRFIAQKGVTERHVLRVVYRQEGESRVVITFYPGRRERYEAEL
jgi:hypothetical protein